MLVALSLRGLYHVLEALTKEKVSCGVLHLNKCISHLILTNM